MTIKDTCSHLAQSNLLFLLDYRLSNRSTFPSRLEICVYLWASLWLLRTPGEEILSQLLFPIWHTALRRNTDSPVLISTGLYSVSEKGSGTPLVRLSIKGTLGVFWDPRGIKSSFFFQNALHVDANIFRIIAYYLLIDLYNWNGPNGFFLLIHGYKTRTWGPKWPQRFFVWLFRWVRMKVI